MLLMSMTMVPGCSAPKTPSGPSSTSSTSGESGTIVMTRVACRATSAGEVPRRAPAATSSCDRALTAAVDDDGVAGLQEVGGHGFSHQPEADESDGFWHVTAV